MSNTLTLTANLNNTTSIVNASDGGNAIGTHSAVTANITNSGTISETGKVTAQSGLNAIDLEGLLTGTLTNTSTGVISQTDSTGTQGGENTIYMVGGITGGIVNSGTISGAGGGAGAGPIDLDSGAVNITNNLGGVIVASGTNGADAINIETAASSTIVNAGTVTSTGSNGNAIYIGGVDGGLLTGSITNTGTISQTGGATSANITQGALTYYYGAAIVVNGGISGGITNSGTISASGLIGAIDIIAGAANITNSGTISQTISGIAIDNSRSTGNSTITNTGTITGSIKLSAGSDVLNINGGTISGDILAGAAGHNTVNIAVGTGHTFTAAGLLGGTNALAAVNIASGNLSVGAGNVNATTFAFTGSNTGLAITGTASGFHNAITGFGSSDHIQLVGTVATAAAMNASNQLVVSNNGTTVATLNLIGNYSGSTFVVGSDGSGGTSIALTSGTVVTNTTGVQTTLTAPAANSVVQGSGYDVLNLSQNTIAKASSAYTITANGDGSVTLAAAGSSDRVAGVLQIGFSDKVVTLAAADSQNEHIALLYQGALGRTPEAAGLAGWQKIGIGLPTSAQQSLGVYALSDAAGGYSGSLSIAGGFTNSPEFIAKYGSLTDTQFVTQLYSNVLDRAPDSAGLAGWVSQLASGTSRDHVLIGFAESVEAISNATNGYTGSSGVHASWLFAT